MSMNSKTFGQVQSEQPQILIQLRQKSADLRQVSAKLKQQSKQLGHTLGSLSDRYNLLMREKEIQERKSRSLVLLVTDLQRQLDDTFLQIPKDQDVRKLQAQRRALREILIKVSEREQQNQKLLSFLRQTVGSGPKAAEFLQRSKYIQGQTEILAKLRSQIASFTNDNLQCSRKWTDLQNENTRLTRQQGFLRIQSERIKTQLKEHYEQYLQRLNRSKAALVNFNQTQRERAVTEHLVEEVAFLQQQRVIVQQQSKNLKHHQEILLEENARLNMENRELKSFFGNTNTDENRLANKMKARIEELRDTLSEVQKLRVLPQLPVSEVAEDIRNQLKHLQQTQNYLQKKIREEQQGKMVIEQKDVIEFFEAIMRKKDEQLQITKQREQAASLRLRESVVRRQLLQSQIDNLEEGLKYHSYLGAELKSRPVEKELEGVSKWKSKVNPASLYTTTSKYVG